MSLLQAQQAKEMEISALKQEQLLNEENFKKKNREMLLELEQKDNQRIKEETKNNYDIKNKTINQFFEGFSESILGIMNDVLYKISSNDPGLSWGDIFTENDRLFYIGVTIVVIVIITSLLNI